MLPGACRTLPAVLAVLVVALPLLLSRAGAEPEDQRADAVLGQPDFLTNDQNHGGLGANSLSNPQAVAVAPDGRLYVADTDNNRVLSWPIAASFIKGQAADRVFGQADFAHGACNKGQATTNQSRLCTPHGVAVGPDGALYVADDQNNRVLRFSSPNTSADADVVFGQADFTGRHCNKGQATTNESRLCNPQGVAVDGAGNLYVADTFNSRVLRYNAPFSGAGGDSDADLVWGQSTFAGNQCNKGQLTTNASRLCFPVAVAVDGAGNLYVGDDVNNRALRFNDPITDSTADAVLGQPDFTSAVCNRGEAAPDDNTMCEPVSLAVNARGDLYVADFDNHRVMRFNVNTSRDAHADRVFGHTGMRESACNDGHNTISDRFLCRPFGVAVDRAGNLYAADSYNNRVLRYDAP